MFFIKIRDIARPLLKETNKTLKKIEKLLYNTLAYLNIIKSSVLKSVLQAVLTENQEEKFATGVLKLVIKKYGTLMANLVDSETKKIVSTITLKEVEITPEISQALIGFSTQIQTAQIAEQIQSVQVAIEEV